MDVKRDAADSIGARNDAVGGSQGPGREQGHGELLGAWALYTIARAAGAAGSTVWGGSGRVIGRQIRG